MDIFNTRCSGTDNGNSGQDENLRMAHRGGESVRQRVRLGRVLVIVLAIGLLAAPACADLKVNGDQRAWADLKAALAKLYAMSFRAKVTSKDVSQALMEFVPPGSTRTTVQTKSGAMEMVRVGGKTAIKTGAAGWRCVNMPQPTTLPNLSTLEGSVDISRGADTTINSTPVHTYLYATTSAVSGRTTKGTWYVGSQTGLPVRFVISGGGSIDYYDYGAAITIAFPSCVTASRGNGAVSTTASAGP